MDCIIDNLFNFSQPNKIIIQIQKLKYADRLKKSN
jgi:hypothetical protein